jgi:LDH2 family malate/lactate/ureidoglycolate dehydrogenase
MAWVPQSSTQERDAVAARIDASRSRYSCVRVVMVLDCRSSRTWGFGMTQHGLDVQGPHFAVNALLAYASALLVQAGVDADKADAVAEILVEGELLGRATHGLALLAPYLDELGRGAMAGRGDVVVLSDRPAVATWDGRRLPGPWLTCVALEEAAKRARTYGTGTVVIRRSHHIACLAAYLERVTSTGLIALIESSDPAVAAVAPHGGTTAVFTPNPIAVGIPTSGDPILIDVSTSITTLGLARRLQKAGGRTPYPWLIDGAGAATDDPAVLDASPAGSLMLLGGMDAGHKGFGLSLLVEALTSGLGGYGRADAPTGWGASVFVQVLDPDAFGGLPAFVRETDHLVASCQASPSADPGTPVRLPGQAGLARKRRGLIDGIELPAGALDALQPWGARFGVVAPSPMSNSLQWS